MWDLMVGEVKLGRLTEPHSDGETTHCSFEPSSAFTRYARAFAVGDISGEDDDALDAAVDEIAVEGVFLIADDGSEIVDPELRIAGVDAWFQSSSST